MIRKNISYLIFISLLSFQLCISQKSERIGYINMEYILSQMEDYKLANQQLEEKIIEENINEIMKNNIKMQQINLFTQRR